MMQSHQRQPIFTLPSIGIECASRLEEAGYETVSDVRDAPLEDLMAIEGIGVGKARYIKEYSNS